MGIVDRLKKNMSYSEVESAKAIIDAMNGEEEKIIITKNIADAIGVTRSVLVLSLRLLEIGGVIESKSLGMKGTNIKVINKEVVDEIMTW